MRWRAVLLAAVAACAACGIIYELALLTLSASLNGGGIVATSLIVAGYIAALGLGALLVKPLLSARGASPSSPSRRCWASSAACPRRRCMSVFAFLDGEIGSTWVLAVGTALIGGLVGAEVPLLMTLLQRGRGARQDRPPTPAARWPTSTPPTTSARCSAGWSGRFVLLPHLGMIRGAAATGVINLVAAAVVAIFLLRRVISSAAAGDGAVRARRGARAAGHGCWCMLHDIETTSRQRLYADPIIAYRHTAYQEIVVTRRGNDTRLYLDGGLQFSTRDEYRYTESLVYPALGEGARSVLVLGGGDGLAARELLRQKGIDKIVQVELDPAMIEIARTTLRDANAGALDNPRVSVVIDDAMRWLRAPHPDCVRPAGFDAVIVDLPDPDTPVLGRLYSTEFYTLVAHALTPNGLVVVQAGSPFSTPTAFWRTVSTMRSAGYAVTPYHVHVPTFGDWGFALARPGDAAPIPTMPADAPPLRYLNPQVLQAATVFSDDIAPRPLEPSTLDNPRIVEDMRHGYD